MIVHRFSFMAHRSWFFIFHSLFFVAGFTQFVPNSAFLVQRLFVCLEQNEPSIGQECPTSSKKSLPPVGVGVVKSGGPLETGGDIVQDRFQGD
jgi:hypothetical protein